MKPRYFPMLGSLFAFTAAGPLLLPLPAAAQAEQSQANEDVEVLTRGPVHEAFAEIVSYEAEAGLIIKGTPPAAIEELPPDQRPDGDNVTWIPGYWAWDDDQNDFLWISGVWRNIPPDRQWVPGYWNDLGDGRFQWISGYWADTATDEVEYVETAPPKSIDSGPNVAATSDDQTWVPGNWMWNESRYVWRPGYWLGLRPNWTWVPARYNYSPRGYVFVDGYWDYAVASRGVLFAPVYYRRHVWDNPGYYYTPSVVVSLNLFTDHLFVRPRGRHYYFGDYYAPRYADMGFYSGFNYHRHHRGYDPIWAYNRWDHRRDNGWERRYEDNYNFFRDNDRARPPHTWAAMRALGDERLEGGRNRSFVRTFDSELKNPERGLKFRPVEKEGRDRIIAQRQEMRDFSRQRRDLEAKPVAAIADRDRTPGGVAEGGDKKKGVFREKLRRSPVVSRQADQLAKDEAPPKRPEPRGNKALKDAATAAAVADGTPGRGNKDRDMVQRPNEGDNAKPDRGPAGRGNKDKADGTQEPDVAQKDRVRRTPGQDNEGKPDRQVQPKPERDKAMPERGKDKATPEREVKPKPEREKVAPERQVQPKPEREVQPKPQREVQPKPQREVQPKPQREVQPKPQREVQPKPQREVQPKREVQPQRQVQPRQPQVKPEKKEKDKDQARVVPQRRPEQSVQRIAQPKPQAQPRPQQLATPKPQARQAQPRQQQAQPKPQARPQAQPRPQQQARPQPQQRQVQPRQQPSQPQQRQNKKDRDKKDNA